MEIRYHLGYVVEITICKTEDSSDDEAHGVRFGQQSDETEEESEENEQCAEGG